MTDDQRLHLCNSVEGNAITFLQLDYFLVDPPYHGDVKHREGILMSAVTKSMHGV